MHRDQTRKAFVKRAVLLTTAAIAIDLLFTATATAQFDTIINVPPNIAPISIGSNTQLNLFPGGQIGANFVAGSANGSSVDVEVNIAGGAVGSFFDAYNGSTINISGGSVNNSFEAFGGSTVNISGGSVGLFFDAENGSVVNIFGGIVGQAFDAFNGSMVTISGGAFHNDFNAHSGSLVHILGNDFRLNGVPIPGLDMIDNSVGLNVSPGYILTGVLTDGTPFAFTGLTSDSFADGTLTLTAANVPAAPPGVFFASTDAPPRGVREGQTLVVDSGAILKDDYRAAHGSILEVQPGGNVGSNLQAVAVDINITGGTIGNGFEALFGSQVTVSGGALHGNFGVRTSSTLRIIGNEFRLNGVPINGLDTIGNTVPLNIPANAILTGVLADGMSFTLTPVDLDRIDDGTLTLEAAELPAATTDVFFASTGAPPLGIRAGQTLVVDHSLDANYNVAPGSVIEIREGAYVGVNLQVVGAVANVTGGTITEGFDAAAGAVVNLSGGSLGNNIKAWGGSIVNFAGGSASNFSRAFDGSVVNISGGSWENNTFFLEAGSLANFYGQEFHLNGEVIDGLAFDESYVLTDRDGVLTGLLADGSPFSFSLTQVSGRGSRPHEGTITLNLIAEMLRGDFNHDGQVNAADYTVWRNTLGTSVTPGSGADANFDGRIDRGDYHLWKTNFGNTADGSSAGENIPEPTSLALATLGTIAFLTRRPRTHRRRFGCRAPPHT